MTENSEVSRLTPNSDSIYPEFNSVDFAENNYEEKSKLITQILELQHTLEDLSSRVDVVKEENLKLRSENQILGQYIENMMTNSTVFQSSPPNEMKQKLG